MHMLGLYYTYTAPYIILLPTILIHVYVFIYIVSSSLKVKDGESATSPEA